MLTSVAAIATALSTLIGVYYAVVAAIKKRAEKKAATNIQEATDQVKKATTPQEREELQNALDKLINS
jgi:hypothetical protein